MDIGLDGNMFLFGRRPWHVALASVLAGGVGVVEGLDWLTSLQH